MTFAASDHRLHVSRQPYDEYVTDNAGVISRCRPREGLQWTCRTLCGDKRDAMTVSIPAQMNERGQRDEINAALLKEINRCAV